MKFQLYSLPKFCVKFLHFYHCFDRCIGDLMGNIDWNNINQIGSPKKVKKAKKTSCGLWVILNRNTFISACIKSWNSICILIIVYENSDINSKHWIELIKFIYYDQIIYK